MQKVNWDNIQENTGDYVTPEAGGYIARITYVEDVEEKEYLRIEWDFENGPYAGYNQESFNRLGWWPNVLIRSYKPKALPFFKAFKTAVEDSNRGYIFQEDHLENLKGKLVGLVLGEQEYRKSSGEIGTRLYVHQCRSIKRIQDGDFTVPAFKELKDKVEAPKVEALPDEDDGELPF